MEGAQEYRAHYYVNQKGIAPVEKYINELPVKEQTKVFAYIELLKDRSGRLDEPYSRHIRGKIRELRIDFARSRHRVFYFTFVGKRIILLHAFLKKTARTPQREITIAIHNYNDFIRSQHK